MGHVMNDCHRCQHAYIVTEDSGYVSASDVEDEYALAANHAGDEDGYETDIDHEEVFDAISTKDCRTLIV